MRQGKPCFAKGKNFFNESKAAKEEKKYRRKVGDHIERVAFELQITQPRSWANSTTKMKHEALHRKKYETPTLSLRGTT